MNQTTMNIAEQYNANAIGLIHRIEAALGSVGEEGSLLTTAQLTSMDHFHTRGVLATADLATAVGLDASMRVLDLGSGIGGPSRYFAETFGCKVNGIDLSPSFVEAATYLTRRCGLSDRVAFTQGNALAIPHDDETFDAVFLHHVAMNIENRHALYAEISRVLKPHGKFAFHDITRHGENPIYPTPWALDASMSFLWSEEETKQALEQGGFHIEHWSDDTAISLEWFKNFVTDQPEGSPRLSNVMGADFRDKVKTLARNLDEGRVGVLSAICVRG